MSDNATILIKKADGTTEKITLAEFHARQKQSAPAVLPPADISHSSVKPVKIEKKVEPLKSFNPPKVESKIELSEKIKKTEFTKDDAVSLLDESLDDEKPNMPLVSQSRVSQADEIINKLNFRAPDTIRLRGLIQLRLKEVRSDEETRSWLIRPIVDGGAGINAMQAEDVLKLCRGEKISNNFEEVSPLKKGLPGGLNELPMASGNKTAPIVYKEQPVPAIMPNKKSFVAASPAKEIKNLGELKKISDQNLSVDRHNKILSDDKEIPSVRHMVRDIIPNKKTSMSPTDEIRFISLVDFRRLSANPEEAIARLKQKFINLKDESYLLYLDALQVWRMSPLYQDYVGSVIRALNQNVRLNNSLLDKNKIQMTEISAIIKMENSF
ncbi:MAG: hypothetical protein COU29_00555 [Candidatus Magasanikbacteria bacterium CG10_big_fil_rev_8_21_14_0_10_36_32]|uniref:Uncharacterized protein n=1 Tax=Candidatus Magasanikbacteria bacterium CG10_big_fil_rev_8_21_14_0_10_36_32 TaxID=1974646 RepID=A0A2M6W7D5_9BACT|nr:MAG: hypothetical protein COU29_00555 [Candidatus Magasanikbacteria bacterium CG10_big_fil_rev_8_21_14_0_10_36_32]